MPGRSKKLSRVASVSLTDLNMGPVSARGPAGSPRNARKLSMIFWRQTALQFAREVWFESQSTSIIRMMRPASPTRSVESHAAATIPSPIVARTFGPEMPKSSPGVFGNHVVSVWGAAVTPPRAVGLNVDADRGKSLVLPTTMSLPPATTMRSRLWTEPLRAAQHWRSPVR